MVPVEQAEAVEEKELLAVVLQVVLEEPVVLDKSGRPDHPHIMQVAVAVHLTTMAMEPAA
jgi:hypothetical protein